MSIRTDTMKGAFEINDEESADGFRHLLMTLDIEDVDGMMDTLTDRAKHVFPNVPLGTAVAIMIDSFVAGVRTDQLTMIEVAQLHGL